jgi:hypothetical protein
MARETGEGEDGWRIPGDVLSLLHCGEPAALNATLSPY